MLEEKIETHSAALMNYRDQIASLRNNVSSARSNQHLRNMSTRLNENSQALINHRDSLHGVNAHTDHMQSKSI